MLKTWSFATLGSYSQSQAVVNPIQFLRASLNFTIKNIFKKSNLNTSRVYMLWTTTPQSFIALGFFIGVYKNVETLSFLTSWIIQAFVNPIQFLRASPNFTMRKIF